MKKILLFISTLIVILNVRVVRALDYHEVGSDYYTNATELATINTCSSSMSLYGYNSELNLYKNGNKPLYILDFPTDTVRCNSSLSFNINRTLNSGETYEATLDFVRNTSTFDINFYLRNPVIRNANLLSFDTTCTGNACTMSFKFEMTANDSQFYIDFPQYDEGLSLVLFDTGITSLYMPQVRSLTTFDTSGIENNQNTIIDQNQTIIDKQEQTNDKLDNIEDSIVESNKETQDVIKDQFNSCRDSINLFNPNDIINGQYFLYSTIGNSNNWALTYIRVEPNSTYYLSGNNYNNTSAYIWILDETKTRIDTIGNYKNTHLINTNDWTYYIGLSIPIYGGNGDLNTLQLQKGSVATNYEPYGEEICTNRIDDTNDKLDGIQGALTDDSSPDLGALENSAGWLPAGPVDSILNLPLSLLNNLSTTLNKSCSPVILTLPYVNKTITLPCIKDLYDKMGVTGTIFNWAGIIAAAFILYNYLLRLYKWVDDTLTMRENNLPGYFDDNWGGGA